MNGWEVFALALLAAALWYWLDGARAREKGVVAVREACRRRGLQLLDDTVALETVRLARNEAGQLQWRRVYGFEFSDTGDNRRRGSVGLLGAQLLWLDVGPGDAVIDL